MGTPSSSSTTENASIILKMSKLYAELDTQHMISTIINRLSAHHKSKWRNIAVSMKDKVGTYPSFEHFVDFLQSISNEATDPVYGYDQIDVRRKRATNCSTNISEHKSICPLCSLNHKLYACSLFKQKKSIDRLDFVKSRNLCLVCFDKGHDNIVCSNNISCRICKDKHSTYEEFKRKSRQAPFQKKINRSYSRQFTVTSIDVEHSFACKSR